jgi:predicted nucleic acid-binding protein
LTVLADTSVWIEHLRHGQPALAELLTESSVLMHPFIAGELSCGNLKNRAGLLADLSALPSAMPASHDEVLRLVDDRCLWGRGLGWVDAHLLASALLSHCAFWTLDGRLAQAAREVGLPPHRAP